MAHTFTTVRPGTQVTMATALGRLIRDNILRVGLVLVGMTLFIAAAEAKTPVNEIDLTNLPQVVSQIAHQSAQHVAERIDQPHVVQQYLASDDYAAQVAPSNLLNSPAARFIARQIN